MYSVHCIVIFFQPQKSKNIMMERRRVGSSSLSVSPLCLGTMTFGEQNSVEEAAEICNAAFNSGINFFDSAELLVPYEHMPRGVSN